MKRPTIVAYDDIEYTEHDQALEPAEHTLQLIVREDGSDVAVELDLTDANHTLLWKELKRWFDAGQPPSAVPERRSQPGSRIRYKRIREFADTQKPPINYRTPAGGYYYSRELLRRFARHEKATG